MYSSINNTYCYKQQCKRVDIINQIIAKNKNNNNNLFQIKFQQFYKDRMILNKIQKKNKLDLHDEMIRLYNNNLTIQQCNLSISTQGNAQTPKCCKSLRSSTEKRRPRSQSNTTPQSKPPFLTGVLRISPKCIATRNTISSKGDMRSVRKNILLDALILEQESQDVL